MSYKKKNRIHKCMEKKKKKEKDCSQFAFPRVVFQRNIS